MTRYNTTHSPALEGCRDRVTALEAENARLREALEAVLNADHRGVYDAAFRREAAAQAEALVAPGLNAAEREARALTAIHHRYSTDERDPAAENRAAIAEQEHGWREA